MNNYIKLFLNDFKKLWDGLDFAQRFGMIALTAITLVVATYFLSKSMEPDWAVLYSDLSEPDAVAVTENLKKNGYPYKIADDKKTILVPSSQKDELRIYVAENDLIKNSEPGFELLDDMQLGSTEFKNKMTKQRIFQGELTRSIEKMNGIKSVRIQIAEPERSIFEDNDDKPTASVMLILEPGYKLKTSQVKAIKNLVAYSVPRLTPETVFITDQNGNSLGDEQGKNSNDMESFKSNFEKDTAEKISTVLEKIMGKGNATVQVSADINFDSAKSTIESYIPLKDQEQGVLLSSQTETETYQNPNMAQNVATVNGKNLNYVKEKTANNYSISKEIKQVVYAPGSVKRMTIAVAVNKILTDKEKEEIQNLVLSASGADYNRGDVITVSSMQFESLQEEKIQQEQIQKETNLNNNIELWTTKIGPLAVVLILGLTALLVIKGLFKTSGTAIAQVQMPREEVFDAQAFEAQLPTIKEEPTEMIQKEDLPQVEAHLDPETERIRMELNDTILADPAEAAKLLTSYIRD
ncbi:MAG: flagellar M-ring protein FliF [bacterium]|nr:flagellar M-ring protein FliF [bacterium]